MRSFLSLVAFLIFAALRLHAEGGVTLRAGDVFDLRLSGVPAESATEYALQYTVDSDGTVNVPLIGGMKAIGLRPAQLERAIEAKLVAEKIFTRPTVVINVPPGSRHVSITGGVRTPGRLTWGADLTLSTGIGECGGITDFISGKGVRLIREGKVSGVYDLRDIRKDPSKDPKLLPGDQVIVPE